MPLLPRVQSCCGAKGQLPVRSYVFVENPEIWIVGVHLRVLHRSIKIYCSCFGGDRELEAIGVYIGRKWIIMEHMEHFATVR